MSISDSKGIVERLTRETRRFVATSGGEIPALGRGRARLAESLRSGPRCPYVRSSSNADAALATVAKDVELERIALPPKAAIIEPSEVILQGRNPERAAIVKDLRQLEYPFSNWPCATLKPCHRIGVDDEIKFARILVEKGMGHLVPDQEVPRGPDGKALVGGWFGVDHTRNRLRLIFDRRPKNATEQGLDWVDLPSGSQLIHVELEPGETIRGSGDDLVCWFYVLAHRPEWRTKNAVGRKLDGKHFSDLGLESGVQYRLCIGAVAMGDTNGVAIAQETHESILYSGAA